MAPSISSGRRRAGALAFAALFCVTSPCFAQAPERPVAKVKAPRAPRERFHIHVLGNLPVSAWALSEVRTFKEFAEDGRIRSEYAAGRKPGYEAGVQFDILPRWGLAAALSGQNRDARATYEAELPHPLYLDRDRKLSGELASLAYRETLAHFDLVHTIPGKHLDISLFGGTSRASVSSEFIRAIEYRHEYPYDVVTLTGTPTSKPKATAFGFNAGAALSFKLRPHIALTAQGRYTQAKVTLVPVANQPLDIDAGGLSVALGARIGF